MTTPIPKLFHQICVGIAYLQHFVVLASTARFRENAQLFADGSPWNSTNVFLEPCYHQKE